MGNRETEIQVPADRVWHLAMVCMNRNRRLDIREALKMAAQMLADAFEDSAPVEGVSWGRDNEIEEVEREDGVDGSTVTINRYSGSCVSMTPAAPTLHSAMTQPWRFLSESYESTSSSVSLVPPPEEVLADPSEESDED